MTLIVTTTHQPSPNAHKIVYGSVFNHIERVLSPSRLADLTAQRLSYLQAKWRDAERSEATIRTYLAHLVAALNWAEDMALLSDVPKIQRPKRAKKLKMMKGRPLTTEEFERILEKVDAVVGPDVGPSWVYYLHGLWVSGLRLEESLDLWWDRDDRLCVDLAGKRPMLWIPAELEKGNQDRLLPMAPEFAEFLLDIPEHQRTGRVFRPRGSRYGSEDLTHTHVGALVRRIGKAARVKVYT